MTTTNGAGLAYRFGSFELWPRERSLLASGEPVALGPKAFDLLLFMLERPDTLLSKDELIRAVWPKVIVEENNLQVQVSSLRRILGASAIETVSRQGYRLTLRPIVEQREATTAPAPSNRLPRALTTFVGREKEIEELRGFVRETRLLTLTGAGGCGKSRLALELAGGLTDGYVDGIWFVELAALTDPALVPGAVASALGLPTSATADPTVAIVEDLRRKHALLILDNAEHLLGAAADLLDELLRQSPSVTALVTSRERLGLTGELTYRVPSLSMPGDEVVSPDELATYESVRLFIERAQLQKPEFTVTVANARALASLCRRLDGIPLAIELAAPCLRAMTVEEIDSRLDRRFGLLTHGMRTALPRQKTLRSMIDWSYDLLSTTQQRLLCRISVFSGGWTIPSAELVCADDDVARMDMLDLVTALVDKNLVTAEEARGHTRYRLLETIREYARGRLRDSGEASTWHRRHARWMSALSQECWALFEGPRKSEILGVFEAEHDNIRAALAWSLESMPDDQGSGLEISGACARFWINRGHLREGRAWLRKFLDVCANDGPTHRHAVALTGAGVLAYIQTDLDDAHRKWQTAAAIWESLGNEAELANCAMNLGAVQFMLGNLNDAGASIGQSAAIARKLGNKLILGNCLQWLGDIARRQQDLTACRRAYEEALIVARDLGNPTRIATASLRLGILANCDGQPADAKALLLEGLTLLQALGDLWHIAGALAELGLVAQALGQPDRSVRLFAAAEQTRQQIGAQLPPEDGERQQRILIELRAAVGDDAEFDHAWQQGHAMSWKDAIQYALEPW